MTDADDQTIIAEIKARRDRRRQQRNGQEAPSGLLPPPSDPMAVARIFIEQRYTQQGTHTLRYWCGSWWKWHTTHWAEVEQRTVRSLLYHFTEKALYSDPKKGLLPWAPTCRRIGDLMEALGACTILSDHLLQPCWLDDRLGGPIVAVRNGLLDVNTRELHAHSPFYFCTVSVPFDYDASAPESRRFLNFLDELWPQEPEAIDALGEWFGYVISGRLDLQKILLMVGPTRGGKGVLARILAALVGKPNVCGPTLSSLNSEFGLAPLIGKSLAVVSDARFSGRNSGPVVERMLSISGEDTLTVNRKYREQWSGKLPTRLHVISNELPHLGDASTAIVGRFIILILSRSWLGKENHELELQLLEELPGILNWSLDGLARLNRNDGRFTRVPSAEEAIITMSDLASPVAAFVRDRCTLHANLQVGVDELHAAFKQWCEEGEYQKSSKAVFGRNLMAACRTVRKARVGGRTSRAYVYQGIRLAKDGDEPQLDL
jgi:putative DNA primase/helicase